MDEATSRLLQELSDAKDWPAQFKRQADNNVDIRAQVKKADEKIEGLEKQAKEAIKRLGCVNPDTRSVYHGMADMLISWQAFKDSLE